MQAAEPYAVPLIFFNIKKNYERGLTFPSDSSNIPLVFLKRRKNRKWLL